MAGIGKELSENKPYKIPIIQQNGWQYIGSQKVISHEKKTLFEGKKRFLGTICHFFFRTLYHQLKRVIFEI
jgi:hypothetical protein